MTTELQALELNVNNYYHCTTITVTTITTTTTLTLPPQGYRSLTLLSILICLNATYVTW